MARTKEVSKLVQMYAGALRARVEYLHNAYGISIATGDALGVIEVRIDDALRSSGPIDKSAAMLAGQIGAANAA